MNVRKAVVTAVAGLTISLGGGQAMAVDCSTINTIGEWATEVSCTQGDKIWTYGESNLNAAVGVLFSQSGLLSHNMQIVGFDTTDAEFFGSIDYAISVVNPLLFYISDMFAGADNPGGGSALTKDVIGDPSGFFSLSVLNGIENAASEKHGLTAGALAVHEEFFVEASKNLLSVSNTYEENRRLLPTPGTLALLGLGLVALGATRRNRKFS